MNTQHAYEPGHLPVWTFADKIRKARDLTGDSQKDFAAKIGITASSLAAYETGRAQPRFKDVGNIAKRLQLATGVPYTWFLVEDDPNPENTNTPSTSRGGGHNVGPEGYDPPTFSVITRDFAPCTPIREFATPAEVIPFPRARTA